VCWKLCSSCWSFHLLQEEILSVPIHSPPVWFAVSVLQVVSGPPHFDGKNYQMWSKRMGAFLHGKGQIIWDVTVDTGYVQPMDFLSLGSRDRFDANNKAVDYLLRALCQPEFDRVHTEHLTCRIWSVLKEAHVGNAQVQAGMYATYRRESTRTSLISPVSPSVPCFRGSRWL
jgi:hypothetical protein